MSDIQWNTIDLNVVIGDYTRKLARELTVAIHAELAKLGLDNAEALAEWLGKEPAMIRHLFEEGYVWPLEVCMYVIVVLGLPIRVIVE